jgi:hypothetical protein
MNTMSLDQQILVVQGNDEREGRGTASERTGTEKPFITINSYNISNYLKSFSLDLTGFLPVVKFSFTAVDPNFISATYPKDGDIVSLYISSPEGYYNPIRMDFNILTVNSDVSSRYSESGKDPAGKGENLRFSIIGECRIPSLYTPIIKSFRNKSSYDTLLEVATDLDLGFASNETSTEDSMTWICPNYSYYDFIQEVCLRSYKDENSSFFDAWVDPYYNLNFVNLGTQFGYEGIVKEEVFYIAGYADSRDYKPNIYLNGNFDRNLSSTYLILRNYINKSIYPFGINGYTLISNSGTNVNKTGYFVNIGFYDENSDVDKPEEKYVNYDIESITSDTVISGKILQKGRGADDEYQRERRREWLGILNTKRGEDGVHINYLHAKYQNLINYNDCTKFTLKVEIPNYFGGIYRGQVVPVIIEVGEFTPRSANVGNSEPQTENQTKSRVIDNFLSGNYVVMGIEVSWDSNYGFRQILHLCKREWVVNRAGNLPKAYPFVSE